MVRIMLSTFAMVVSLAVAIPGDAAPRSADETEALESVLETGARVDFEEENPSKSVVAVNFYGAQVTDTALAALRHLPRLTALYLCGSEITDAGLKHVADLTQLKRLNLCWGLQITDEGLANLKGLRQLECLDLGLCQVSDIGLSHISGLTRLEELNLAQTEVTDAGLKHLQGLTQLKSLDLSFTRIAGAGLAALKPLTQLRTLGLGATKVDDGALAHLESLTQLRSLDLAYTCVSDDGIAHLEPLVRLESLNLDETAVTRAGVRALASLPVLKNVERSTESEEQDPGAATTATALPWMSGELEGNAERGRFEVAARLEMPEPEMWARSLAFRVPWVYVLGGRGNLYVFRLPDGGEADDAVAITEPGQKPLHVVHHVGDGTSLIRWDDTLIANWFGNLDVYSITDPEKPKRVGRCRTPSKRNYDVEAMVRSGRRLFLLGDHVILTYDLSTPARPIAVGEQRIELEANAGCVHAGYLYVGGSRDGASGEEQPGIVVFDLADISHLQEVAFLPMPRWVYHVLALPGKQLLVSMEADSLSHSVPVAGGRINAHGRAALLDVADPKLPVVTKEMSQCGGRAATVFSTKDADYFVCDLVVFSVHERSLEKAFSYISGGSTGSGFPYRGDSDGGYTALPLDNAAVILRCKGQ